MKLKQWQNIFQVIVNANSIVQHVFQIKNKTCQCECRHYRKCKKEYSWNPNRCICENRKYLTSIAYTSVIMCDEVLTFMDIASIKMTNTKASNVSKNCQTKKTDCYIAMH